MEQSFNVNHADLIVTVMVATMIKSLFAAVGYV